MVDITEKKNQARISPSVLVMCLADPSGNPRPRRMIELLLGHGLSITTLSFPSQKNLQVHRSFTVTNPPQNIIAKATRLLLKILIRFTPNELLSNNLLEKALDLQYDNGFLWETNFDLIVVENLELLPLAIRLKELKGGKILFDAREFYPKEFEDRMIFRLIQSDFRTKLCSRFLPLCDQVVTVSPGLAEGYLNTFQIKTSVIRSVPNYIELPVKPVTSNTIRMVHHGNAHRGRKLENMIAMFDFLDERFTLDFYLCGDDENYKNYLMGIAKKHSSIRFLNPVPFEKICPMLNTYDIGLYLLEPTGFNTQYCLPNKLFEFIQARLMLAIGPSPDMSNLVKEYQCGIVADSFEPQSMANYLNKSTTEDIEHFKRSSDRAARTLCFEEESKKLDNILNTLLTKTISES